MKNYIFLLIIIKLFVACEKNNKRDNLTQNNMIPASEINNLKDSNVSDENIDDKASLIQGIWADGENGTGWNFFYFTADKALFGIFSSGFFGVGNWSITDNDIHLDGEAGDEEHIEAVSASIPFAIIDYDTIKIRETIFTRISEEDLSSKHTSKDLFDELMKQF